MRLRFRDAVQFEQDAGGIAYKNLRQRHFRHLADAMIEIHSLQLFNHGMWIAARYRNVIEQVVRR